MARSPAVTVVITTLALLATACGGSTPPKREPVPVATSIAIVGATLWDGTGRAPVPNAVTLVRNDRIHCAGAAGECPIPAKSRVIDARGRYLIPGLIDSQPPAMAMQQLGWKPLQFDPESDPEAIVAEARKAGAMGLKLYAQLDSGSVRRLTDAAHRAGMPVWGHAWVQPASVMEQVTGGQDGVVHAAGLAGELFTVEDRDTLVRDGDLQTATAAVATVGAAHDPRVLAALDSMARKGTMLEPTLDAVRHSVASYDAKLRHIPSLQEDYVRSAARFGMEVTRQAVKRGVRISAGSDHVSYGPASDRATLFGELRLLVDSIGLSPTAALLAATRDAARAIGGQPEREAGTIQKGRYADLVLLAKNPLEDVANLEAVELVMAGGKVWRPGQLRSGIATR